MKIGIVGYGSIGRRHAANAVKLGHETVVYDPVGPCDVKFERHVYEQADAVVIATPSPYHEGPLRACIEHGKHALVEKPISVGIGVLPGLLKVADEKKLVVMMGNNLRFHPCIIEAKRWLDAGYLGRPLWAQFTCATLTEKPAYLGDGVILNTGSHEVDLALHLLGSARLLYATGNRNIADFVLEHENGCRSNFHLDFVTAPEVRSFRVAGGDGHLWCDLPNRLLRRYQPDDKLPGVVHGGSFYGEDFCGSYDGDYVDELATFIGRITYGRPMTGATGADGLATLRLLLDVKRMANA